MRLYNEIAFVGTDFLLA